MSNEIDFVITELTVEILTNNNLGRASFVFIDQTPHFPKVNNMLNQTKIRTGEITLLDLTKKLLTKQTELCSTTYY